MKLLGHDVQHSRRSSAEVKNQWSYTSIPSVYIHEVDRDNFAFTTFYSSLFICVFSFIIPHLFIYLFTHSFIHSISFHSIHSLHSISFHSIHLVIYLLLYLSIYLFIWRPGWRSRCSDSLRSGQSVYWTPVRAKISVTVHIRPEVHPGSRTMGTGSFSGLKRPRRGADYPPLSGAEVANGVKLYCIATFRLNSVPVQACNEVTLTLFISLFFHSFLFSSFFPSFHFFFFTCLSFHRSPILHPYRYVTTIANLNLFPLLATSCVFASTAFLKATSLCTSLQPPTDAGYSIPCQNAENNSYWPVEARVGAGTFKFADNGMRPNDVTFHQCPSMATKSFNTPQTVRLVYSVSVLFQTTLTN